MTIVQTVSLCAFLWLLWKVVLRRVLFKSTLDNIPGPASDSFLTGNLISALDRHEGWAYSQALDEQYAPVVRLHGLLGARVLYVWDSVALQHMLAQDGVSYSLSGSQHAKLIFGPGLVSVWGEQHRRQRKLIMPAFSADSIRNLMPGFHRITHKLRDGLMHAVEGSPREIDVLYWLSSAALEFVAQAGMGRSLNSISPDGKSAHPLAEALKKLAPTSTELKFWWLLTEYWQKLGPPKFRRWLADLTVALVPDKNLRLTREIIDTMDSTTREFYQEIKASIEKADINEMYEDRRKNIMSILIFESKQAQSHAKLSDEELLAQISTMLFAGTDTTSGSVARMLQLLAMNPEIQEKLREELESGRDYPGQELSYEKLMELPLLDAVCRETLRLYPPANLLPHETIKDVVMPLQKPITGVDGRLMNEIVVPKGTLILPSYRSCNTSKSIWGEDALEWKPYRWLSSLPATVSDAHIPGVYSNLMTFGGGHRSCIGIRLAILETKMILAVLIPSFSFALSAKKVYWNWCPISYPSIDPVSVEPSLMLTVTAIKAA